MMESTSAAPAAPRSAAAPAIPCAMSRFQCCHLGTTHPAARPRPTKYPLAANRGKTKPAFTVRGGQTRASYREGGCWYAYLGLARTTFVELHSAAIIAIAADSAYIPYDVPSGNLLSILGVVPYISLPISTRLILPLLAAETSNASRTKSTCSSRVELKTLRTREVDAPIMPAPVIPRSTL